MLCRLSITNSKIQTDLNKYFEIKENQAKLKTQTEIASKEELDYEPEKQTASVADVVKLKTEKDRQSKKLEQFRNEINILSGKYLGLQRKFEAVNYECTQVKEKFDEVQATNETLQADLVHKEKEIQVMVEFLRQAQPANKENIDDNKQEQPAKKPEEDYKTDPDETKRMFQGLCQ